MSTSTTDKAAADETRQGRATTRSRTDGALLRPFSDGRIAFGLLVATALMLIAFNRFPGIDIEAANLFFAEAPCADAAATDRCGTFPAASSTLLNGIRDVLHVLPPALAGIVLAYAVIAGFFSRDRARVAHARGAATAVASLVICSLGIVNFVLKEYSGRPRPQYTDLFGGQQPFVEAGRFADYCAANCSFVSGESSAAFWLLCLVPLVPRRLRAVAAIAAFVVATTAAGLRMAFGAHYLSDVAIAAMLSLSVFALLATLGTRLGWYRTA